MFNTRLSVTGNSVSVKTAPSISGKAAITAGRHKVESTWMPQSSGSPMSVAAFGGATFQTMFQGIIPEFNEAGLIPYYRDIYYHDSVAGSAVDISSTFPFSDLALTGLESADLKIYNENISRINIRTLMQEISLNYLVDGQFTGTLVYDPANRIFQDVLMHDALNTSVTLQPFHSLDPVIKVNSSGPLNQMLAAGSPYLESVLQGYPEGVVDRYRQGTVVLDPLTTLFIPRKGAMDRASVSYLKRVMPMYMLERIMFRGTVTEAQKRQRATSHIKAGDENWIPTDAELQGILSDFQRTELDPLGAWIITRQGVEVTDVRSGGEFWKWTDLIDTMVPYKLRALGISEAFLSGEASYATAEAAITVFLDSMDSFRQLLTHRVFVKKVFPLIAVLNGMYKDPKLVRPMDNVAAIMANLNNQKNLRIPTVNWFKSLNGKDTDSQWDMLDQLSQKGFTIPMKMWAAAASVDISSLLQDLEEDQKIKESLERLTGQKAESIGVHEDSDMAQDAINEDMIDGGQETLDGDQVASLSRRGTRIISQRIQSKRKPLLSREMDPQLAHISKSGKVAHSIVREKVSTGKANDMIVKAMKNLSDPNYRASVRSKIRSRGLGL